MRKKIAQKNFCWNKNIMEKINANCIAYFGLTENLNLGLVVFLNTSFISSLKL
jgi:hypothetical protein|tara:strand:+ start:1614 stop:1772 length:159 start_codon:yes stop_codon:yes gene_type:complete